MTVRSLSIKSDRDLTLLCVWKYALRVMCWLSRSLLAFHKDCFRWWIVGSVFYFPFLRHHDGFLHLVSLAFPCTHFCNSPTLYSKSGKETELLSCETEIFHSSSVRVICKGLDFSLMLDFFCFFFGLMFQ